MSPHWSNGENSHVLLCRHLIVILQNAVNRINTFIAFNYLRPKRFTSNRFRHVHLICVVAFFLFFFMKKSVSWSSDRFGVRGIWVCNHFRLTIYTISDVLVHVKHRGIKMKRGTNETHQISVEVWPEPKYFVLAKKGCDNTLMRSLKLAVPKTGTSRSAASLNKKCRPMSKVVKS